MARFSDLPEELVDEIMSWLPPESLKRFKRVCKSWYFGISSLMNNPAFVAKHLRNTKSKLLSYSCPLHFWSLWTMSCPEVRKDTLEGTYYFLTVASTDSCSVNDDIPCVSGNLKFLACSFFFNCSRVVSQCNGIVCCYDYDFHNEKNVIFLLNPALSELKIVPDAHLGDGCEIQGLGFGYDSNANDYKVVTIESEDELERDPYRAELYSLSTNSWKEIKLNVRILDFSAYDYQVVYCSGICYWYFWDFGCRILSFDFRDEVFRDIPFPKNAPSLIEPDDSLDKSSKIVVWNGSITLFFYLGLDPLFIDMWVMDSHSSGVKGSCSWTRHLTIGPLVGINQPVLFWGSEVLFMESKDHELISYYLPTKELDDCSICMEQFSNRVVICEKSLVSVLKEKSGEDYKMQSTSLSRSKSWVNETKKAMPDEMFQQQTQQTQVIVSSVGSSNRPSHMVNDGEMLKSVASFHQGCRKGVGQTSKKGFDLSNSHSSTSTYPLQQPSIPRDLQQWMSQTADCHRQMVDVLCHRFPGFDFPVFPPPPPMSVAPPIEDEDDYNEDEIIQKQSQQTQVSSSAVESSNLPLHMVTNEEIGKSMIRSGRGNMTGVCPAINNSIGSSTSHLSTSTYPPQQPSIPLDLLQWMNQMTDSLIQMVAALHHLCPGIDIPMPSPLLRTHLAPPNEEEDDNDDDNVNLGN